MMTEHYTHNRAETICIDATATPLPVVSSKGDQNGGLLYPSMMHDGVSIAYPVFWELSCAVCEGALWRAAGLGCVCERHRETERDREQE